MLLIGGVLRGYDRCRYVDYMLLMTFNYHGSWNEFTGHHSAVHPRSDETGGQREWNQVSV